ncbi:MAG: Nif3-like dinuclear metal center hexameric protein [Candidatus Dasytiphilus stammeri]
MRNTELEKLINQHLNSTDFHDYVPNGLQVTGREEIKNIITGVTACQALLDQAVAKNADAIIVHHGYFWKNELPLIQGIKRQRLKTLLVNDINLYSWHLPLDAHPQLGNNAQLAKMLDIKIQGEIVPLLCWGTFLQPLTSESLITIITSKLGRTPLYCANKKQAPNLISSVAWCTGAGQKFITEAANFCVDAFITGEASESTIHSARENNLHFFAAGHHATERGGIQALTKWLKKNYALNVNFIDIYNPV